MNSSSAFYSHEDDEWVRNSENQIPLEKRYDIIVDTRKFEIENFSKRAAFFWGVLLVVSGYYFSEKISTQGKVMASLVAFFFSVSFSLATRGAKYWQKNWEVKAELFEKKMGFQIFGGEDDAPFRFFMPKEFPFWIIRFSPSKITIMIADFFTVTWLGLMALSISEAMGLVRVSDGSLSLAPYHSNRSFDLFSTVFWVIGLMFLLYLIRFIWKSCHRENTVLKEISIQSGVSDAAT